MPPLNSFSKTAIALALSQLAATSVDAAVLTVNRSGDDIDQSSCSLRDAIVSVNSGVLNQQCGSEAPGVDDQIIFNVADQPISPFVGLNSPLEIFKPVRISGAGINSRPRISGNSAHRIFRIAHSTGIVRLENLELYFGSAINGAAILHESPAETVISNLTIRDNDSTSSGGGMHISQGAVKLLNSEISLNIGDERGGGISVTGGAELTINSSIVSQNRSSGTGGGILVSNASQLNISQTAIEANASGSRGGGLLAETGSTATITDSLVAANYAETLGGGLYSSGTNSGPQTKVIATNVFISFNDAQSQGGGVMANNGGIVALNNATVLTNFAYSEAGGVAANVNASVSITNSIISANETGQNVGNEIWVSPSGDISFAGRNVLGRSADNSATAFANVSLRSTDIVATSDGNTPTSKYGIAFASTYVPDFGGEYGAIMLLPANSPAVDKAVTSLCPTTDLRGEIRDPGFLVPIVASNDAIAVVDLGDACDIGAVERRSGDDAFKGIDP